MTIENSSSKFFIGNKVGQLLKVQSGVLQGGTLPTMLFNIALRDAVKDAANKGIISDKTRQICAYADNLIIACRSEQAIKEANEIIYIYIYRLVINENKYLKLSSVARSWSNVKIRKFMFKIC